MPDAAPLSAAEFTDLMAALGPWPARPSLAVAVSGGPDSLALTLLLAAWTWRRGGRLLALTVDHGLRPGSAREARQVGRWLAARGIRHRILTWRGQPPAAGPIQAAARDARYRLLAAACRRAGILQLCLAHQREDQAETLLLRLAAGSGLAGLAGMAAIRPTAELLLLRPLLGVPRRRLTATLAAADQPWLEDPSNQDPRYQRVALRRLAPALAADGLDAESLGMLAQTLGRLRAWTEACAATLLAAAMAWHPAGFAWLNPSHFVAAPPPVARLALAELLRALGGGRHAAGTAELERALAQLAAGESRGFTLAGVRLVRRREGWLAVREARDGEALAWASWRLRPALPPGWRLEALGRQGWQALAAELAPAPLPGPALWSLPALVDAEGLHSVPALGWRRPATPAGGPRLRYRPEPPAGSFGFTVACAGRHII